MTENTPHGEPQMDAVRQGLDGLRRAVRDLKRNIQGGRALAATPDGRAQIVAARTRLAEWRRLPAGTVRDLAEVDRVLDKALKKRWGLRV